MYECKKCKQPKEPKDFYKSKTSKNGLRMDMCIDCRRNQWLSRSPEQKLQHATKAREYRKNNPDKVRQYNLKSNYGITIEEYDSILSSQGGLCGICRAKPVDSKRSFHVDHNHDTGFIRGILCSDCNTGIGKLKDSVEMLELAIAYLERTNVTVR